MFWKREDKKAENRKKLKGLALVGGGLAALGFLIDSFRKEEVAEEDVYHELEFDSKRNYFLVYQNASFDEESSRGYIWAPKKTESGRSIFHWDNLKHVREGDIVFSLVDRKIVSINVAETNCFDYRLDDELGYRADLDYNLLENPIDVDDYMEKILDLSPDKYAPFNVMGRSNSGYLFELGEDLGDYLLEIVKTENKA